MKPISNGTQCDLILLVFFSSLDQDTQGPNPAPSQSESSLLSSAQPHPPIGGKCSRTYITFSDDATFQACFPHAPRPQIPMQEVCPVTHKPALYRDPITDIPYANLRAFKIIREAYNKYVAAHGLPNPLPGAGTATTATAATVETFSKGLRQKLTIKQGLIAS